VGWPQLGIEPLVESDRGPLDESLTAQPSLLGFAGRVAIATLVVLGILVGLLFLWQARLVVALLLLAVIIASALRPGVDWLARRGIRRGAGVVLHYATLVAVLGVALWLVVPAVTDQVTAALAADQLQEEARRSTGVKHEILLGIERRLAELPSGTALISPAVEYGRVAFEVVIGVFFVLASSAYWLVERDRAVDLVCSLLPRPRRKRVRDTWDLIELRLGAFVRGQTLLIVLVAAALSACFRAIGLPYWLLVGVFGGIVEIVPVVGPLAAGLVAVGVGLSVSTHLAVVAGIVVLAVRLLEDYLVIPRVLGHSVGLSPLVVLVAVTSIGVVLGGFAVILAVPLASILATLLDTVVRAKDPAQEHVPSLLSSARDTD
jgi:predicted PurR-regulated permease PerM